MADFIIVLIVAGVWSMGFFLGMGAGHENGEIAGSEATMQQAFERGYAVQCIGKTGYHWECGE